MLNAVLATFWLAAAAPADLPVPNPSFETDADHDGVPDGWRWNKGAGEGSCRIVTDTRHSGQCSVMLTGAGPAARLFLQAPAVKVKPAQAYVFSCWAKTDQVLHGNAVLGIARYGEGGKWDNWSYTLIVPRSGQWRHYEQVFTMPATTRAAAFRVWIERFQGTAWFDDVSWREYHAPKPGWTVDLNDIGKWSATHAELTRTSDGALLTIGDEREAMALFHIGAMERELAIDLERYPVLSVTVDRRDGLWAIKTDAGYLQHHTDVSGTFYYDLPFGVPPKGGTPNRRTIKLRIEVANEAAAVVVRSIGGHAEAPPRVDAPPRRTSRYVKDVTLDGLDLDRRHPFVAISRAEVARIKAKEGYFPRYVAGLRSRADALLKQEVNVPAEPSIYATEYNCPQHGVPLRWRSGHPREHQCPAGHVVAGAELDRQWRITSVSQAHRNNRRVVAALGGAYVFTGDERYAARVRDVLLAYTRTFPGYPYHSGRGDITPEGSGMRVECEALGEAGWLAAMARGYDMVAASPALSKQNHEAIRRMFAEDVKVSLRYDEGLSNRQAHHNLAVSAVGLILGDEFLTKRALGSLRYQLKHAVLGDGLWWECSPGYHYYAVRTLREVAETFQRVGIDAARDPKLRLSFDGPLRFLLPDGTYPAVNDSHMGHRLNRSDFEMLYHLHRDPVYAGILAHPGYRRERTAAYGLYGGPLGETAAMPNGSWNFFQAGMSVLKTGPAGRELCAVVDYGQTVAGHGHMDKLNLVLFAQGRLLLPDIGTRSYFSPVYRFWDRQTLSHNTVVVDERSQKQERGRLTLFDGRGPVQLVQATADEAYPCLDLMRTVIATPDFVVDLFRVTDDAHDARTRPGPANDIPHWTKYPWGTNTPASLRRDVARFERSRDAHSGRYCAMIAHSTDLPAYWATEIRRLTGPNRCIRHGVVAATPGVTYRLSGWVKTRDATGTTRLVCSWLGSGTRGVGEMGTETLSGTRDWTRFEAEGKAPSRAQWAQARCLSLNNDGAAWFDDLALVPLDGPAEGRGKNILGPNADFELDSEPHQSIDYVLHGVGTLTCRHAAEPSTGAFGEDTDDPSFDGRNSYRYLTSVKTGSASGPWTAEWTQPEAKLRAHVLAGAGTRIFTGVGQGKGATLLPMLMARRTQANTVFAAVLDPYSRGPDVVGVEALRAEGCAPTEAYGVAVTTGGGRGRFVASFTPGPKRFDGLTLDAAVAAAHVTGAGKLAWLYLVDGRGLSCAGGALLLPGSYKVTVVAVDSEARTVTVREPLPAGTVLRGSPLVLDLPYNECFAVAEVRPAPAGSAIVLEGLPNLHLRPGTTATIPSRAFVRWRRAGLIEVCCNTALDLRLPNRPRSAAARNAAGRTAKLPITADREGVRIRFAEPQEHTLVALDVDEAAALDDAQPPRLVALRIDGQRVDPSPHVRVGFRPRGVTLTFEDPSGLSPDACTVTVNGRPAPSGRVSLRLVGRGQTRAELTVRGDGQPVSALSAAVSDLSFLRNVLEFRLETALPFDVIAAGQASAGRAVKLLEETAKLTGTARLAKGRYEVNVIARAYSDGANSLWLDLDGRRMKDPIHLRTGRFGNSSRSHQLTAELPRLGVERDGEHRFTLSLREAPGPELDKIQFLQGSTVVHQIECESLSAPR